MTSALMTTVMAAAVTQVDTRATASARGVLTRLLYERATAFVLSEIPVENGLDVFVIEARDGQVHIGGSSGVAMTRGAYEYLRKACGCQVTWDGDHMPVPARFPDFSKTRMVCPNRYRHYFNVCTFGYTTVWWDWARWEREIDWMALHGINMPLAMNGQEAIWQRVWLDLGLTQHDLDEYFTGPAFLPWHRMGNINAHAGPLPQAWIDAQKDLQKRILARERELGMTPVVPAFSGFVPPAFAKGHPKASITRSTPWAGFEPTCLLGARDPMFTDIGRRFIQAYRKEFGSDHLYLADTFNEMTPRVEPASKLKDLAAMGEAVYRSILAGDPDGIWVMQGWLFFNERAFWGKDEVKAFLDPVPDDRMILIDLACDQMEVWRAHEAFRRKQWLYCTLHNFGQTTSLFGNLAAFASKPAAALNDKNHGRMVGMGITPEGIEQNAVVYELLTDAMWRREPIDLDKWIADYCKCRYGEYPPEMREAWTLMRRTIYAGGGLAAACMYMRRPRLDAGGEPGPEFADLRCIIELYLSCAERLRENPLFERDLVDIMKRYLESASGAILADAVDPQEPEDEEGKFWQERIKLGLAQPRESPAATRFLGLVDDLDRLLMTQPPYQLQTWLRAAQSWGHDWESKKFYEHNARLQVTIWGGPELYDYAWKEWSGLTSSFYAERWRQFFDAMTRSIYDPPFKPKAAERSIVEFEEWWTKRLVLPPVTPPPDTIQFVRSMLKKYPNAGPQKEIDRGIAVGKPVTVSGGTEGDHKPECAVDGYTSNLDHGWYASPYPQWLQIDLQKPERIESVQVFPYWDGQRYYQYTVEVSADGKEWTRVVDMSKNTKPSTRRGDLHKFTTTQARYVRVIMLHNSANIGVHLIEVRVFAAK